jgi:hypothetical protein
MPVVEPAVEYCQAKTPFVRRAIRLFFLSASGSERGVRLDSKPSPRRDECEIFGEYIIK